jgi:site-specific DNA-methyltransferase (adenine-specific)
MPGNNKKNKHAVHFSSASDDWPTPQGFYDRLDTEFDFALDVCASKVNHKAPRWYGLDHPVASRRDGLLGDWVADAAGGAIWMNAPYGTPMRRFMAKAVASARRGATVVSLVPVRTDTRWWHASTHEADVPWEVRFLKGRLRFGHAETPAPFPSGIIVLGPRAVHGRVSAMSASAAADAQLNLFAAV